MQSIARNFLLFCLCVLSCSCARLPNQGNIKAPIQTETYYINITDANDWKPWAASTKPEHDTLILNKLKKSPLTGEVQGFTTITVLRNTVAPEGWNLAESEHADSIRAIEEKIMLERGVKSGKYEVSDLIKGDLERNGKKLYSMTWTAVQRHALVGTSTRHVYTKGAMYLYFPENFKDTHAFYQFLITDTLLPPTFLQADTEQIYPVIDAFTLK